MNKLMQVLTVIVITTLLCTIVLQAGFNVQLNDDIDSTVHDYEIDDAKQNFKIESLKDEKAFLTTELNKYKDLYYNYEPKVIYKNTTEYKTIYRNKYIDDAIFDVNRDGDVDYNDVGEVLWYINHGVSFVEDIVFQQYGNPYEKLYDVNCDGNVNISDVDLIWDYAN